MRKKQQFGVILNDVQKKAVLHLNGPLLLLASPGSGKTTTTIMRIGYLIEEKGVDPNRIKAITFSRASASDMKERFARFFPEQSQETVDFSTIHSLAFEVVREYFYKNKIAFQLIEGTNNSSTLQQQPHKKQLLRNIYKSIINETITEEQLEELQTYISYLKNTMIPKEEWSTIHCDIPSVTIIVEEYERIKNANPTQLLLDYDDMLTIANDAFSNDEKLLHKYQQRYDYVLTDESQDTSLVQHFIIEKVVKPHKNVYVVADDDQSIYSWRGAEPQYLIDFKNVYPDAVILKMEQNYRSSKQIVDVARKFIKRNKERYDKEMFTNNPPHKEITIKCFDDYRNQAKYIVSELSSVDRLEDIAVLYRNNSSSIMLMNEFERSGISFYMKDTDNRFFSHWVVKDILNFMRMSYTDRRFDVFEQIYNKCGFYISKEQLYLLAKTNIPESIFDRLLVTNNLKAYQIKQIQDCKNTLVRMKGATPLQAIKMIRNQIGYDKTLKEISKKLGLKVDYLIGVLQTLEEIAGTLQTMEEFAERLKHLENLLKASVYNKNQNAVTFSTFHSSKGLEFKKVYMVDLVEGVIPGNDEIKQLREGKTKLMEEAVRLFYVGMTRAELELELLTYKKQYGKDVRQSQFLTNVKNIIDPPIKSKQDVQVNKIRKDESNIPYNPNAVKTVEGLEVGAFIKHRVFGHGEILEIDKEKIHIQFQRERKTLLLATCIDMGLLELAKKINVK
ncbi:ATP-dependent helicase [Fredinandcohnia humi]